MKTIKEKIQGLIHQGYDIDDMNSHEVGQLIKEDPWDVLGVMFSATVSGAEI